MKIGVIYPQTELGGDPKAVDIIGRSVELLGYDYLVMFDHVAGAVRDNRDPPLWGPYSEKDPFHDPLVAFGYLSGVTQRIELVTGILVLPQRPTVLVARQTADIDFFREGVCAWASAWVGIPWNSMRSDRISTRADFGLVNKSVSFGDCGKSPH